MAGKARALLLARHVRLSGVWRARLGARLPSSSFAFIMAALIYLHMRRFRRGGHLDAALITVGCAAVIGFARGASTDMQMAAPFCIGLLGWYAWYETDSKFWLFDIYFFTGVATLAKGPVAPFLAFMIIVSFAALRREWSILTLHLVARHPALLRHRAALVPGRAASKPDLLPRIFPRPEPASVLPPTDTSTSSRSGITA